MPIQGAGGAPADRGEGKRNEVVADGNVIGLQARHMEYDGIRGKIQGDSIIDARGHMTCPSCFQPITPPAPPKGRKNREIAGITMIENNSVRWPMWPLNAVPAD